MNSYRFAGTPKRMAFEAGKVTIDFIPDSECVVRYKNDKGIELTFFVLTNGSTVCIGSKYEDVVKVEIKKDVQSLFSVGSHVVMELESVSKDEDMTFPPELTTNMFRLVSLAG